LFGKEDEAEKSLADNVNLKYDCENMIKEHEGYVKSLKGMLGKLNNYNRPFK
jgi:hypothetical protein